MRRRLEKTAGAGDVKRGPGGIVDIEFLAQMLQLRYARRKPAVRQSNTLAALEALAAEECLSHDDGEFFRDSYRLLRKIESRLRLMNSTARDQLPDDPTELAKLAHLLGYRKTDRLLAEFEQAMREIRRRFDRVFDEAGAAT